MELVRRAQRGEEAAFAELVRGFQDIAVAYATSILGDYHLAEDAAQEAFLDAYRSLASLREPAAFAAWLRRIVFKQCDRITRRRSPATSGIETTFDIADPSPWPDEQLEQTEAREALNAGIAKLSEAERQVVLLYYMGQHSQSEIADFLNVTTNTVKTRLYSARRRLRAHMDDIEKRLHDARPSGDPRFAEKVRRLIQPEALKQRKPWMWSPGIGTDVWEMFCACMVGDLDTVEALVERDPSLVRCHYEYRTPLSFAVRNNHLAVAEFLLDHGASKVSLGDPIEMAKDRGHDEMVRLLERMLFQLHGSSAKGEPVAEAIRARDLHAVRRLLDEMPEQIHAGDRHSNQPIHWAVMTRNLEMIDEVLARGADINARRGDAALPIHLTNGDYDYRGWRDVPQDVTTTPDDVYRHLVAHGAEVDLGMAAFKDDIARVRRLLERDPSLANRVSGYNSYYIGCGAPLKNAAAGGNIEIVRLLLEHGADPNLPEEGIAPQGHALHTAVSRGYYDIAKLLLQHGAHPNPRVESSADAVWIAIRGGDRRMLELLGAHGAVMEIPFPLDGSLTYQDLVATGIELPVSILASYGDLETAAALFAEDPELANDPMALENAASGGHEDFVRALLVHHPDLARHVTVARPRRIAELLFEHGMDPDRPDWMRKTPLHHFASRGDIESAALFLDNGANIHARDEEHCSTPLAIAAMHGQSRMVAFLLRRGAQPNRPDDPPWAAPIRWAERRGHDDVVRILLEYETSGPPAAPSLEIRDNLAKDFVAAYESGDERALQTIKDHFRLHRALAWDRASLDVQTDRLRRAVRERLARPADTHELSLDDARQLVASSEGFATWADLVRYITD
jgi:RNA polymerase sigma factor (sigma-70 family)